MTSPNDGEPTEGGDRETPGDGDKPQQYQRAQAIANIARAEHVLRSAVIDVLCGQPDAKVGKRLRTALNESREPGEHPEDRCEECRRPHAAWSAPPDDWARVSGRCWGGPILCEPCFRARLKRVMPESTGDTAKSEDACPGSRAEVTPGGTEPLRCPDCNDLMVAQPYKHPDGTIHHMLPVHPCAPRQKGTAKSEDRTPCPWCGGETEDYVAGGLWCPDCSSCVDDERPPIRPPEGYTLRPRVVVPDPETQERVTVYDTVATVGEDGSFGYADRLEAIAACWAHHDAIAKPACDRGYEAAVAAWAKGSEADKSEGRTQPPPGYGMAECPDLSWEWYALPTTGYHADEHTKAEALAAMWAHHDAIYDRGFEAGRAAERAAAVEAVRSNRCRACGQDCDTPPNCAGQCFECFMDGREVRELDSEAHNERMREEGRLAGRRDMLDLLGLRDDESVTEQLAKREAAAYERGRQIGLVEASKIASEVATKEQETKSRRMSRGWEALLCAERIRDRAAPLQGGTEGERTGGKTP